jgi:hypothetical protein
MIHVPYVYKWVHKPSLNWYVGSRTRKGCHPEEKYICSSKYVKPLIIQNPNDWEKIIIATGEPNEMRSLEADILYTTDARNDSRSYNLHNGDGKFTTAGKKMPPRSEETIEKIRSKLKLQTLTSDQRKHLSDINKGENNPNWGLKRSDETKRKQAEARRLWWAKQKFFKGHTV